MPAIIRLNPKEANELADVIEAQGGNADSIRAAVKDVSNPRNGHSSVPTGSVPDEEWLEDVRKQSEIQHGEDLECMMCFGKFEQLVSDVCENCFREWMLPLKPKRRETPKLL